MKINPSQAQDLEQSQYQEPYDKGFSDGFNNSDKHDAEMSYGNSEEIAAYLQGVEDGSAARSQPDCCSNPPAIV